MRPNDEHFHGATECRSSYGWIFETIAQLYRFHHVGVDKVSTRFDEVKVTTEKLKEEGILSDYIYENLQELFELYPTLLPGQVQKGFEEDREKEIARLNSLYKKLAMTSADLSQELHDDIEEANEHEREMLFNRYNRY